VKERFAKELSVSGVNQCMRRQNLREIWKRLSGGEQKAASFEFIALMPKARLDGVDGFPCKTPRLGAHTRDEIVSLG
jgi:hypothetical protein